MIKDVLKFLDHIESRLPYFMGAPPLVEISKSRHGLVVMVYWYPKHHSRHSIRLELDSVADDVATGRPEHVIECWMDSVAAAVKNAQDEIHRQERMAQYHAERAGRAAK